MALLMQELRQLAPLRVAGRHRAKISHIPRWVCKIPPGRVVAKEDHRACAMHACGGAKDVHGLHL
eukprot:10194533-Prorocentrum_lima.AAC.1